MSHERDMQEFEQAPIAKKLHKPQPNTDGSKNPFYEIPKWVNDCDDLIEYLELNYFEGCILKSLWTHIGKRHDATNPMREAKKRKHYSEKELTRLQKKA
jgi:hypothetical protein